MRKLSILLLAAMAMVSCGNTYKAQTVELNDQTDSLNYALGLVNGVQIRQYYMQEDSSDAVIDEFISTLELAYQGKLEELTETEKIGKQIATSVRENETDGLVGNPSWQLNEKVLMQALVNGLEGDTTMMQGNEGRTYLQTQYSASRAEMNEDTKPAKAIKCSKLPKTAKTIDLKNQTDSLNYAYGVMTGSQVKMYVLANDTDGNMLREFRDSFDKAMKAARPHNAQLVGLAENIGTSIREQEPEGLLLTPGVETRFALLLQGFVNGMHNFTEQMEPEEAQDFVGVTMEEIKKAPGVKFLKENAEREGVFVTESGLQYEIIQDAKGKKPQATDRVKVHYEGKLINGEIFDSSIQRGEPITFALNQVIPGWTEGVQLMSVGAKYRFFIPYELGYGERGAGQSIPPYATLIFEVELLGIEK